MHFMSIIILTSNHLRFEFTCMILFFKFILRYTTFYTLHITIFIKYLIKFWFKSHLCSYYLFCWCHCHLGFYEVIFLLMYFLCKLFLWQYTFLFVNWPKLFVLYVLMWFLKYYVVFIVFVLLYILVSWFHFSLPFKYFFLLAHL